MPPPDNDRCTISASLRLTLLAHALLAGSLGSIHLLAPTWWAGLVGWPMPDPGPYRFLGLILIVLALGAWWSRQERSWERIKILVQVQITWTLASAIGLLAGLYTGRLPGFGWVYAFTLASLALALVLPYTGATGQPSDPDDSPELPWSEGPD